MLTRDLSKLSIPVVPKLVCIDLPIFNYKVCGLVRRMVDKISMDTAVSPELICTETVIFTFTAIFRQAISYMTFTSFETILYQHLTPFFERHGFVWLPEKKQYRYTTDTGFQNVLLAFTSYGEEAVLEISFGCRNEQVEQIAQQFLSNQVLSRKDANTVTVSINQFTDFQFVRFNIQTEDELIRACEQIELFFQTTGFPFLTASSTISALDHLLNDQPGYPCQYVYNQMHRCYKGLITARLNHNAHFDGLIDRYRHMLVHQTQNPYEQIQFERLIAYLHHYSVN